MQLPKVQMQQPAAAWPRLELLGAPRFIASDGSKAPLGPRVASLVALIALGGASLRGQVATLLYPLLGAAEARRNLRQLLHKQRPLLAALIEHDGERMQLRPGVRVDALPTQDHAAATAVGDVAVDPSEPPVPLLGNLNYDDSPRLQAWLDGERARRLAAWRESHSRTSGRRIERGSPAAFRPPVLVGRKSEWQALSEACEIGVNVCVTGSAGLGKTRLLTDFACAGGERGRRLLMVSARRGDDKLPHAVVARLSRALLAQRAGAITPDLHCDLAGLLPELGETTARCRRGALRLIAAVRSLVEDAVSAGLEAVVFDDVQYADDGSLGVFRQLASQCMLRWMVAYRETELSDAGKGFIFALSATSAHRAIALSPLCALDVHALIVSLGIATLDADTWAGSMHRRSGGNPLYLLESAEAFTSPAPG